MFYFFSLYLVIQILSFGLLPLTSKLFSGLTDKGYAFSKSSSLIITGFIVWFLVSLNLFPFTRITLVTVSLALIFSSLPSFLKFHSPSRKRLLYVLFIETLFLFL
ncbi:hypothetical protein HYS10_00010, partial [Candidatus Collierbacteria bacterium]|nr:hypothetical protein [Candidatus Collierbacteria bacterium]